MVDNQHQKISGYRNLTQNEIDLMNSIKSLENDIANLWHQAMESRSFIDGRWMNIAKTKYQEATMAFVRAVARPADPFNTEPKTEREL